MICYVFKRRRRMDGQVHESREWFGALRMEWEHGAPPHRRSTRAGGDLQRSLCRLQSCEGRFPQAGQFRPQRASVQAGPRLVSTKSGHDVVFLGDLGVHPSRRVSPRVAQDR